MDTRRELAGVYVEDQLDALESRIKDPRPPLTTPFPSLNAYLHRGGLLPGNLVILGGRKGTRKTTVALNLIVHLLREDVPVGFVTLDESLAMYTSKLMSAMSRYPSEKLEENWDSSVVRGIRADYAELAANLVMTRGVRPTIQQLQAWLDMCDMEHGEARRPRVVVIDYASLLVHYRGRQEHVRVTDLMEELQVWTHDNELVTVVLHQAGRQDEGLSKRYHGDTPMTAEALMYAGESQADIILGTYRPALNQLGNMSLEMAQLIQGDSFDEAKWAEARERVHKYRKSTFLQLLKNRPSTKGECFEGIELYSPDDSQYMCERSEYADEEAELED